MPVEPPTEEEFDRDWIVPADFLSRCDFSDVETAKRWAVERLSGGLIRAVSRSAQIRPDMAYRELLRGVLVSAWSNATPQELAHFWGTGDIVANGRVHMGDGEIIAGKQRFFDVRFDPASLAGKMRELAHPFERKLPIGSAIAEEQYQAMVPAHEAYAKLNAHFNDMEATRAALIRRLSNSVLGSVAQLAMFQHEDGTHFWTPFPMILSEHWSIIASGSDSHLWITSEIDVDLRTQGRYGELEEQNSVSYLGIRFDRSGLNEIAPLFLEDERSAIAPEIPAADLIAANANEREMEILGLKTKIAGRLPAAAPPVELKSLPLAEYGNLSRALVAGWGTTLTETQAWERAKAMFPGHKVGRDRFLAQYRKDRPDKKRGKQPLGG